MKKIYEIRYPKRTVFATAKFKARRATGEDGFYLFGAEIKLPDGTIVDGFVELDERSSGEHFGTGFICKDGTLVWQNNDDFPGCFDGRTAEQVFPYKYRPRVAPHCEDFHRSEDGWSV